MFLLSVRRRWGHSRARPPGQAVTLPQVFGEDPLRTFTPKPADINRAWHVIDAEGAGPGPGRDRGGRPAARQAQADLGPPRRRRRPRHRGQRGQARHQPPQARRQAVPPALRVPGRPRAETLEHLLARDPERRRAHRGPGHAAEGPSRPRADPQAEDLRRSRPTRTSPSSRSPGAGVQALAVEEVVEVPKPLIQSTGRRKEAVARVSVSAPAPA